MPRVLTILLLWMLLGACTDENHFRIEGTIAGEPTMNIRVMYYSRGALQSGVAGAQKGKFEFFGDAPQPTLVNVYDYDYRLLGYAWVKNGEQVSMKIGDDITHLQIDGTAVNRRWSEFLSSAADSLTAGSETKNRAVEEYVAAHPDDVVSTLLMISVYDSSLDPLRADSVMESISVAARPASLASDFSFINGRMVTAADTVAAIAYYDSADSVAHFRPERAEYSVITLVRDDALRADSVNAVLKRISRRLGHRVQMLELSADRDTGTWEQSVSRDTATWHRG